MVSAFLFKRLKVARFTEPTGEQTPRPVRAEPRFGLLAGPWVFSQDLSTLGTDENDRIAGQLNSFSKASLSKTMSSS